MARWKAPDTVTFHYVTEAGHEIIQDRWGDWLAERETKTTFRCGGSYRAGTSLGRVEKPADGDGWIITLQRSTERIIPGRRGRPDRRGKTTREQKRVRVPEEAIEAITRSSRFEAGDGLDDLRRMLSFGGRS